MRTGTARPTRSPTSRSSRSSGDSTGLPSNASITSPTSTPAAAAGLPLGDRHHEQRRLLAVLGALAFGQRHGLAGDAKIPAFHPSVLEDRGRRLQRNRRRDDDAKAANFRGGGNPRQAAFDVHERAAGKPAVHRGRGPQHLGNRAAAAGRQRPANDRDDAGARGERRCSTIAPAPAPGDPREVTRSRAQARGRSSPSARRSASDDAGSHPMSSASRPPPSGRRTRSPSSRPSARVVVSTMLSL